MSTTSDNPVRQRRRFRWSLRTLLIVVGLLTVLFAVIVICTRPKPELFNDPRILNLITDPDHAELYSITSEIDVVLNGDKSTAGRYPVYSKQMRLRESDVRRFRSILADPGSYVPWVGMDGAVPSVVPVSEFRIRFVKGAKKLDFEVTLSHAEVFLNGREINAGLWKDGKVIFDLCEETIANSKE